MNFENPPKDMRMNGISSDVLGVEKAELHCHGDNLLSPWILGQLHQEGKYRAITRQVLEKFYPVKNMKDWLVYMEWVNQLHGNNEKAGENMAWDILRVHLQDLRKQHVTYCEIMWWCWLSKSLGEATALFQAYREDLDNIEGIDVHLVIAIGRTKRREKIERQAQRIIDLFEKKLVCGMALAGDEAACTVKEYKDIFDEFHKKHVPVEIHTGEWGGPESVWDALEYGRPKRIGHGLAAFEDEALLNHIAKQNIHIEFCPTSNRILTRHKHLGAHPIKTALERNMNFSINTDDPGPFECTMASECQAVQETFGLDRLAFENIYRNSLRSSFKRRVA